jgi:hypothetical protein
LQLSDAIPWPMPNMVERSELALTYVWLSPSSPPGQRPIYGGAVERFDCERGHCCAAQPTLYVAA